MPRPRVLVLLAAAALGGCTASGATRLAHDQVDYSRAIDEAKKRQTLSNIVGLRYADTPAFLPVTQIISSYELSTGVSGSAVGSTVGGSGTTVTAGATAGLLNHPTFTFTPVSGEEFAAGYIRPLSPALILPLAQSGVPIDLLLRISAQSVGGLQNSAALAGENSSGSAGFFELIHALRKLQLSGALTVRYEKADGAGKVFMVLDTSRLADANASATAAQVRRLLGLNPAASRFELVYGGANAGDGRVGIVTRSVIGILTEIGAQIEVPLADVQRHATTPTVRLLKVETRPTIIIHVATEAPQETYGEVPYHGKVFWIDADDFDSKFAFSVVQQLIALAESSQKGNAPIVTIPAG